MAVATLSIDLEARLARLEGDLNRATVLVERQSTRMESSFAKASSAAKGIGAGIIAGLSSVQFGQFLRDTGAFAQQVERLATLSNQSTQEFQRQAEAARTVGIDADKLGDIFKDVQDKVGDFLQNGAGPLQDFFNNIAPRVGVTAEQFRKLGGGDALQLYVSSLERANLSQAEMTFYLEAIASDSTLLLPLLRNNGKAMQELGDQAERTGVILDTKALAAAQEFNRNLQTLEQNVTGLARSISGPLIAAINDLFALQKRGAASGGGFFSGLGEQLKEDFMRDRLKAQEQELERLRPGAERARENLLRQPDSFRSKAVIAEFKAAEKAVDEYRAKLDQALYGGGSRRPANEGGGRVNFSLPPVPARPTGRTPSGLRAPAEQRITGPVGPDIPDALADALRRIEQTDTARLAKLREELQALVNLSASGNVGAADALPGIVEDIARLDPAGRAAAEGLEAFNRQAERLDTLLAETDAGRLQAVTADIGFLNEQFAAGKIANVEQWAAAVRNATKRLGETADQGQKADDVARELGLTFSSAAEDAIVNFTKLSDVLKGLEQDILRILARKLITEPLENAATNIIKGIGGSSGGSTTGDFLTTLISSFFGSAKGNAFGPAGVMPFANGGVVDSPTFFGFGGNRRGVMGEAGPEAILPLRRDSAGRLGVAAAGGGKATTIIVQVQAQQGMTRDTAQQQGLAIGRGIQQSLARNG